MGFPFNQNSLFPRYDINDLLEMECDLAEFFHCYQDFNGMNFQEFLHKIEIVYNKEKTKNIFK